MRRRLIAIFGMGDYLVAEAAGAFAKEPRDLTGCYRQLSVVRRLSAIMARVPRYAQFSFVLKSSWSFF